MFDILTQFFDWLVTQFWDVAQSLLMALLSILPFPDWVSNVAPAIETMVSYASYPFWLVGFDVGLPILASATGIRFIIRRIPGIG